MNTQLFRICALALALSLPGITMATPNGQPAANLETRGEAALRHRQFSSASQLYERAYAANPRNPWLLFHAARSAAAANQRQQAWALIERAVEDGFTQVEAIEGSAELKSFRDDAKWPLLRTRMLEKAMLSRRLFDSPALATPWNDHLSAAEMAAGLGKLWAEVRYNFADVERLEKLDWDALYLDALAALTPDMSSVDYYKLLMRLSAQLQDGHSGVFPGMEALNKHFARPALETRAVQGQAVVTRVLDEGLRSSGVRPGDVVTQIDGLDTEAWLAREVAPLMGASTPQDLSWRTHGFAFLIGPKSQSPQVQFEDAQGNRRTVGVPRLTWPDWDRLAATPALDWQMLPGGVAHIRLHSFGSSDTTVQFLRAFPELRRARAWILDVRDNGGGDSSVGYRILATLTRKPFLTSRWSTRDYRPAERAWGYPVHFYQHPAGRETSDSKHHFAGPVAVLTGPGTYSAAEDFVLAFNQMGRGPTVGEPTGGSTGQPLSFALPGGGAGRVCTKRDMGADGLAFVGVGLKPTLQVRQTLDSLRAGRDEVLEAALKALRANEPRMPSHR